MKVAAGRYGAWLEATRRAQNEDTGIDVPCGSCNACCRASYFIHIQPDEIETLALIPDELLFSAPGLPEGHRVMGYNEKGCCPMLVDNKCSIYAHRPLTCRIYDCRVFAAAGIDAGGKEKAGVNRQLPLWVFDYPEASDTAAREAVRAVLRFIKEHADCFPGGKVPTQPSHMAMLAIKAYRVFLPNAETTEKSCTDIAKEIMTVYQTFEQ